MNKLKIRYENRLGMSVGLGEAWSEPVSIKVGHGIEHVGLTPHLLTPADLVDGTMLLGGAMAQVDIWGIERGAATIAWIRGQRSLAVLVVERCTETKAWHELAHLRGHMPVMLVSPTRNRVLKMPTNERYAANDVKLGHCSPLSPPQLRDMLLGVLDELENPDFIALLGFEPGELREATVSVFGRSRPIRDLVSSTSDSHLLH
jgi:hypothetical protein